MCSELAKKRGSYLSFENKEKFWGQNLSVFPYSNDRKEKPGLKAEGWCNLEIIDREIIIDLMFKSMPFFCIH